MPDTPPTDVDNEEMVSTLKGATALHLMRLRGRITARELAGELGCHLSTAYDILQRLELSRRFVLSYKRPYWYISDGDFRARHEK